MSNYNRISHYYDTLARLVFGNSQVNAQKEQLAYIKPNNKILIVGGGTGWILEEIAKIHPTGLTIDYVELSSEMIAISKQRNSRQNKVNYLAFSIENLKQSKVYDVVITAFLFDNFIEDEAGRNFLTIDKSLIPNGLWFFSDFDVEKKRYRGWKNLLMKAMYLFFYTVAEVKPKALVDVKTLFNRCNYEIVIEKWYYKKLIRAAVYRKTVD